MIQSHHLRRQERAYYGVGVGGLAAAFTCF
jgi:hypothetical protein